MLLSSAVLTGLIGLYKSPMVQGIVPSALRWDALPPWARWLAVVLTSYLGGAAHTLTEQVTWPTVLWGGMTTAVGAMGLHDTKKIFAPKKRKVITPMPLKIKRPKPPIPPASN